MTPTPMTPTPMTPTPMTPSGSPRPGPTATRRVLRVATVVSVGLIVVIAAAGLVIVASIPTMKNAAADVYPAPATATAAPPAVAYDPNKPTVAILLGQDGANVADTLAPYEVLSRSGGFNTYLVAPERRPVTLGGGLTVWPHHGFADLAQIDRDGPEIVVVPQMHGDRTPVERWITSLRRTRPATVMMSVCVGAETLANTGILDGHSATSHWLKLIGLRRSHPEVEWVDGVRFVDHGTVITTGGVLMGIDGALRLVERFVGATPARRVADEIHWRGYVPGGDLGIDAAGPRPADLPAVLSAGYRWNRPHLGVLSSSGVGEIELASAYRPYTELSYLATLSTYTADGNAITTAHGVTVVPNRAARDTGGVDRIIVPGKSAAERRLADRLGLPSDIEVDYLHTDDAFGFDGAIADISRHYDRATARWVAKSLQYPTSAGEVGDTAWPWGPTTVALLLIGAAGVLIWGLYRILRFAVTQLRNTFRVTAALPSAPRGPDPTTTASTTPETAAPGIRQSP